MNRSFLLLFFVFMPLLLSGCWDINELNNMGIVTGIAIDKGGNEKYKMSVEIINAPELTPEKAGWNTPSIVYSLEGESIANLSDKMNMGVSKQLIYSHLRTLVISEEVAREGLLEFFHYIENNREIRDDFDILIAKDVSAEDVISIMSPTEKVSSLKIFSQLKTGAKVWGSYPKIRLSNIISALVSEGRQPVMAAVTVTGSVKKGGDMENNKNIKSQAMVEIINMGVFKKEKLLGYLSINDIRNYLWTQDQLDFTSLTIPCNGNKIFTVRVNHSDAKIKAEYRNGKSNIQVNLEMEARIEEFQCKDDITKVETYKTLENKIESYVKKEVEDTIKKVQEEYEVDIFGFGEDMNRQDYYAYKKIKDQWDEKFTEADIDVKVLVKLRRTEIFTKGFLTK